MAIFTVNQVRWSELKVQLKQRWTKLTENDLSRVDLGEEDLIEALRKRYGYGKAQAEFELKNWVKEITAKSPKSN